MKNLPLYPAAIGVALVLLSGCQPRKYLIEDYFIPQTTQVARSQILLPPVFNFRNELGQYHVQVCDIQDGKATNCKTTVILTDLVTFQNIGGER